MGIIVRNYIYLDEESIQGLYSQIYDNVLDEKISVENSYKGDVNGEIEATGLINSLVGLGADIGVEGSIQKISEKHFGLSIQKKTNLLISKLSNDVCVKIKDILDEKHPLKNSIIFVGEALFTLTAVYDKNGVKTKLDGCLCKYYNENPSLILKSGSIYNLDMSCENSKDDNYELIKEFGDMKYDITMHMGGDKIKESIRHLTHHIEFGKKFLFRIFGEIFYNGNFSYAIKPFAIWR